jgi:RNA polymerase sigma factor (sigma-70 family)
MASGTRDAVIHHLERLFTRGTVTGLSEGQLLDRFVTRQDESAFEALLERHGPMVLGVCRQLLRDPNDVDDAFQATFLVLVRKADTLRRRDLVGNWLYGVAYRVAVRSRALVARRHATETPSGDAGEFALEDRRQAGGPILEPEIHEEVHGLPEKYRAPVVLCYLEGLSHEEAAGRLGWPLGTVKGRLARARKLLRARLTRRGLALCSELALLNRFTRDASAAVHPVLASSTVKAATLVAAGKLTASALVSAEAVALSEGVVHAMSLSTTKTSLAALLVTGTVMTGAGVFAFQHGGASKDETSARKTAAARGSAPAGKTFDLRRPTDDTAGSGGLAVSPDQLALFEQILQQRKQWDEHTVDRLAHWSRAVEEAQEYLSDDPTNVASARKGHRERLQRILATVRLSPGPNQAGAVGSAQRWLDDERRHAGGDQGASAGPSTSAAVANSAAPADEATVAAAGMMGPGGRGTAGMSGRAGMTGSSGGGSMMGKPGMGPMPGMMSMPGAGSGRMGPMMGGIMPRASGAAMGMPGSGGGSNAPLAGGMMARAPGDTSSASPPAEGAAAASEPGPMVGSSGMGMGLGGIGGGAMGGAPEEVTAHDTRLRIAELAPYVASFDKSPTTKGILTKLDEPISMNFANETTLEDIVNYIREASRTKGQPAIPIYVDPAGLAEAEKTLQSPVVIDLEGVPLKTTLRLLLKQLGLAYCVKDGLLIISSPQGIVDELEEFDKTNVPMDDRDLRLENRRPPRRDGLQ